jgi:hypothetical protein
MKKIFYTTLFLFIGLLQTDAQHYLGVKGGVNYTTLGIEGKDYAIGYHVGGLIHIKLGSMYFFQPEFQFTTKGTRRYDGYVDNLDPELKSTYEYISIPLMMGITSNTGVSFAVGPDMNFLVGAVHKSIGGKGRSVKYLPNWDFAITGMFGVTIKNKWGFQARYSHSFNKFQNYQLVDMNGLSLGYNEGGKNRMFQLGFFYFVKDLKKKSLAEEGVSFVDNF